jgi:hypothetical protein
MSGDIDIILQILRPTAVLRRRHDAFFTRLTKAAHPKDRVSLDEEIHCVC